LPWDTNQNGNRFYDVKLRLSKLRAERADENFLKSFAHLVKT
jgi:hypothetical protein